jgi:predicted Zn-dependent protease
VRTETLVVSGAGFLAALQRADGQRMVKRLGGAPVAMRIVLVLAIAVAVFMFAMWRWGVPALAERVARVIPASWEQELGAAVLEEAAPESLRVVDPVVLEPVEDTFRRLVAATPDVPDKYQVHVILSPTVNAYALPGGHIVITTGILHVLDDPDELAAVLGHEATHLTERHTTRGILEQAGLGVLLGLLAGGDPGLGRVARVARTIGQLSYSRDDETAADAGAARLLARAGMSPLALVRVHDRIAEESKGRGPRLEFLSTHPLTSARRARALEFAKTLVVAPAVSPPDTASWRSMEETLARAPYLEDATLRHRSRAR